MPSSSPQSQTGTSDGSEAEVRSAHAIRAPLVLSIREAADRMGCSVSHMERLARVGAVPTLRLGRRRVIPVRELEAWIRARTEGGGT